MNKQICKKCLKEKDLSDFDFRTDTKAYRKTCTECHKETAKTYRDVHVDQIRKRVNKWDQEHKKERSVARKKRHQLNKEYENAQNKKYAKDHADELNVYYKQYRKEHKEEISIYGREYRQKNKKI